MGNNIDMTERKPTEEARLDAQYRLAHANRVPTIGQLTASIAYEVNQSVGALVTNAHAALRLLKMQPPHLGQACQPLEDFEGWSTCGRRHRRHSRVCQVKAFSSSAVRYQRHHHRDDCVDASRDAEKPYRLGDTPRKRGATGSGRSCSFTAGQGCAYQHLPIRRIPALPFLMPRTYRVF